MAVIADHILCSTATHRSDTFAYLSCVSSTALVIERSAGPFKPNASVVRLPFYSSLLSCLLLAKFTKILS